MDSRVVVSVVLLALGALCWVVAVRSERAGEERRWLRVSAAVVGAGLVGGGLSGMWQTLGGRGWAVTAALMTLTLGVIVALPRIARPRASRR